jgi:hypothetical protein
MIKDAESLISWLFLLASLTLVAIMIAGCSVTVSYDLPSKTIQDWFVGKKIK